MSMFSKFVNAIFGQSSPASAAPVLGAGGAASGGGSSPSSPLSAPAPAPASVTTSAPASAAAPKPMTRTEVEAMIVKAVGAQGEKLDWKRSIVDLMKALKLDSSLAARKELAQELGYKGELDGSAEMNTWLHQQVMAKLAEGGGTVPESLKV